MQPKNLRFGGGGETFVTPTALVLIAIAILLILLLRRKYVIVPFLAAALAIPLGQVVVVAGLHFMMLRILVLAGWARVLADKLLGRKEETKWRLNLLDKVFMLLAISSASAMTLLFMNTGALINNLGFLFNAFGIYFLLRHLIRDAEDVKRTIKILAVVSVVFAASMVNEQLTGRNWFGLLGGVQLITAIREGRLRSQGPFAHPIIAGCFGATLVPLCVGLWALGKKCKKYALAGILSGLVITITSASSTPALALVAGIGALCLWPIRGKMRWIRWGIVLALVSLQMVMKAPVWALISRVGVVGGSSGWDRYNLVNQCIMHFKDWWLVGTNQYPSWGWSMWDLCNDYVAEAERGGLLTFVLFIGLLTMALEAVGRARKQFEGYFQSEFFIWAIGCALFAHMAAFFGISYFDQMIVVWYALLAIILAVPVGLSELDSEAPQVSAPISRWSLQPAGGNRFTTCVSRASERFLFREKEESP